MKKIEKFVIMDMCGNMFNLGLDGLDAKEVHPLVAIHSLAYTNRFWKNIPVSVATHSVELAKYFKNDLVNARWSLIHEVFEAYTGDIPTPIKKAIPQYKELEDTFLARYAKHCNLPETMPEAVHNADKSIMIDEAIQYMPKKEIWLDMGKKPLNITIKAKSPLESKLEMAKLWLELELPDPGNQVAKYVAKSKTFGFTMILLASKLGFWAERKAWKCS